jgi:ABC-type nitrate/sulfonate/bicarbonate transport system substrate-binding protein
MFNTSDAPLVCKPYVKDIQDIKANKRSIIISGKQSGSHLLIQKLARDNFGDSLALENQIVLLGQVQTLQAFASGTKGIDCAIQGAPISNQLREMGNPVLDPGPTGFLNAAVINTEWAQKNPKLALVLLDTIKMAQREYSENMPVLARAMVERHNLTTLDADTIVRYYKQMNIVAVTKFTPAVINWLHLTEELGMLPAGSMKAWDSRIIWREDLL